MKPPFKDSEYDMSKYCQKQLHAKRKTTKHNQETEMNFIKRHQLYNLNVCRILVIYFCYR